ncbi:GNAT family N-acetyltransferase [Burkholderia sp. 3C]
MSAPIAARILTAQQRPTDATFPALRRPAIVWDDHRWWRYVEHTEDYQVRYLGIERHGELAALAPLLLASAETGLPFYDLPKMTGNDNAFGVPDWLSDAERATYLSLRQALPALRADQYPSLALATFGAHPGIVFADGLPPSARAQILAALPGLLRQAATELGCRSCGALYLSTQELSDVGSAAREQGFQPAVVGAETILDLPEVPSFDAYLNTLNRNRRRNIQRELAEFEAGAWQVRVHTGADAITPELIALQAALRIKHGLPGDAERIGRDLHLIAATFGDDCVVISAHQGEHIDGFALYLRSHDRLYARTGGFHFDENGRSCYFPVAYYEAMRWAMTQGIRSIYYGLSAYEAKRHRGCRMEPRWGLFRFHGSHADALHAAVGLQGASEQRALSKLGATFADAPVEIPTLCQEETS